MSGARTVGIYTSAPEVLERRAEDLLTPLLALLIADVEHVAHEGSIALAVWQLVRVYVADRADDGLQVTDSYSFHSIFWLSAFMCSRYNKVHLVWGVSPSLFSWAGTKTG